ncbi:Rpn family recombination-promoting nuclease/putative transposase [Bacteroides gallinaceum]|uniref:Rpn family recombination-promoting nuclease/putative transposase n=1 Tax=Bacteroides gallinaceum TaxID=1462571 RepID=A0ABT7X7W3_9BACE|nr:Rpn family recombination-promoting nuclease/putative transposase [Bacteroides gallinaceum]MDN0050162.1 Rpn family recombination-promoting nuclease/putative transposase [Bacteroides gallinaceum]
MKDNFIRFDWAMKRLLRDKSNYVVLEGFLSTLLEEDLRISRFLESESNQIDETDKFNRADILVEDSKGRLLVIKIQNYRELYYYHQMLYGASDILSRYTDEETDYNKICKIYSINIVYFSMIKSKDYAYHGEIIFRGLHDSDNFLKLSARQQEIFTGKDAKDIFPEYYVLCVNDFDKVAKTPLDEWIKFLKTGEIDKEATAKGLPEARERLRIDTLPDAEKRAYYRDMEALRYQRSVIKTGWDEGHTEGFKEGKAKGRAEGEKMKAKEVAKRMKEMGLSVKDIIQCTGLTHGEIEEL